MHDHDHGDNHGHDHHHHGHGGLKHYHDEDMQSVALKTDKPLNPDKFFPWVQDLVATEGKDILRCKGILSFKDDPERFVFQGVHMILDGDHQRAVESTAKFATAASFSSAAICRRRKSAPVSKAVLRKFCYRSFRDGPKGRARNP